MEGVEGVEGGGEGRGGGDGGRRERRAREEGDEEVERGGRGDGRRRKRKWREEGDKGEKVVGMMIRRYRNVQRSREEAVEHSSLDAINIQINGLHSKSIK